MQDGELVGNMSTATIVCCGLILFVVLFVAAALGYFGKRIECIAWKMAPWWFL